MAEIATIARPYAEALFKAVGQDAASASVWLDALAAVAANDQLRQFADSPKATANQVYDLLTAVAKVQLPMAGQNFLRAVIDNGRLAALPEIARQFQVLKNTQQGTSDAVVYSAFAIDAAALAEQPLAGHDATSWLAWGTIFTELQTWLVTPIASIQATPLQVLMKRYTAQEVQA